MANEEELQPNDIQRGRTELVALKPVLAAAAPGRVRGISLSRAAVAFLALARLVRDRGWRPHFERLPLEDWSITHLDQLEPRALALHVLLQDLATAEATAPGPKVPLATVRKAYTKREEMLQAVEFALQDDEEAMKEAADIRRGSGYADLHSDLARVAVLYRTHKARLAEELPRRFKLADADEAERLAGEILAALTDGLPPAVRALRLEVEQLFGLIEVDHDQVVRGGTFLFWGKPEQAHFVPVRTAAR
jgi:hypothetical protein